MVRTVGSEHLSQRASATCCQTDAAKRSGIAEGRLHVQCVALPTQLRSSASRRMTILNAAACQVLLSCPWAVISPCAGRGQIRHIISETSRALHGLRTSITLNDHRGIYWLEQQGQD